MQHKVLKVNANDNVIVALRNLEASESIAFEGENYVLPKAIAAKHKFVTHDLNVGDHVTMYGVLVGKATQPIKRGEQITTANLIHESEDYSTKKRVPLSNWQSPDIKKYKNKTFMGYLRSDGQVGTANYWLVIPLVFCENRNILKMKDAFDKALGYAFPDTYLKQAMDLVALDSAGKTDEIDSYQAVNFGKGKAKSPYFPNIDGVKFLTHEMGCGGLNADQERLAACLRLTPTTPMLQD